MSKVVVELVLWIFMMNDGESYACMLCSKKACIKKRGILVMRERKVFLSERNREQV